MFQVRLPGELQELVTLLCYKSPKKGKIEIRASPCSSLVWYKVPVSTREDRTGVTNISQFCSESCQDDGNLYESETISLSWIRAISLRIFQKLSSSKFVRELWKCVLINEKPLMSIGSLIDVPVLRRTTYLIEFTSHQYLHVQFLEKYPHCKRKRQCYERPLREIISHRMSRSWILSLIFFLEGDLFVSPYGFLFLSKSLRNLKTLCRVTIKNFSMIWLLHTYFSFEVE